MQEFQVAMRTTNGEAAFAAGQRGSCRILPRGELQVVGQRRRGRAESPRSAHEACLFRAVVFRRSATIWSQRRIEPNSSRNGFLSLAEGR